MAPLNTYYLRYWVYTETKLRGHLLDKEKVAVKDR